MNIRKTTRGSCRTCKNEAYEQTFGATLSYNRKWYEMTQEQRKEIGNRCKALEVEYAKRNMDNLYAITTVSEHKVEVICKTCLTKFLEEAQKELGDLSDGPQKESVSSLENFPLQIS